MAAILYYFKNTPYFNLTNQCHCACTFCLRATQDSVGSADTLWHKTDPSWEEIQQALEQADFSAADEAVFCGYGEPLCAFDNLKRAARWLKEKHPHLLLRVDTNGLGDLINGRPTARELAGLVDAISISLNAPNAARYNDLVRPRFGEGSYEAMLQFARDCLTCIPSVRFSVVDVLSEEEIAQCRAIAEGMGVPLRVRVRS